MDPELAPPRVRDPEHRPPAMPRHVRPVPGTERRERGLDPQCRRPHVPRVHEHGRRGARLDLRIAARRPTVVEVHEPSGARMLDLPRDRRADADEVREHVPTRPPVERRRTGDIRIGQHVEHALEPDAQHRDVRDQRRDLRAHRPSHDASATTAATTASSGTVP